MFLNPSFSTVYTRMDSVSFAIKFVTESVNSFHLALCRKYFRWCCCWPLTDVTVVAPAPLPRGFASWAYAAGLGNACEDGWSSWTYFSTSHSRGFFSLTQGVVSWLLPRIQVREKKQFGADQRLLC